MQSIAVQAEFLGTPLTVIEREGQKWLTADQVGRCLGFAPSNARKGVAKLFNAHADEFGPADKADAEVASPGGQQKTFIFSATGCHLLGMFAQTPNARPFRAWAKQVLAAHGTAAPEAAQALADLQAERDLLREALLAQNPQYRLILKYHAIPGLTQIEKARLMGWATAESWRNALCRLAALKLVDYRPDPRNGTRALQGIRAAQKERAAARAGRAVVKSTAPAAGAQGHE